MFNGNLCQTRIEEGRQEENWAAKAEKEKVISFLNKNDIYFTELHDATSSEFNLTTYYCPYCKRRGLVYIIVGDYKPVDIFCWGCQNTFKTLEEFCIFL